MSRIKYIHKGFKIESLRRIDQANEIILEFREQGFTLTLRQLYYQFVARGLLENKQRSYKNLGTLISDGRMAGLIDWHAIEDRTRKLEKLSSWQGPEELMKIAAEGFRRDRWTDQPTRVEVWIEKEALAGVFEPICKELEVPFFCCRGYPSKSEMWRGAMRFTQARKAHRQDGLILHFGDHDPSGMNMTEDIEGQMRTFGAQILVDRQALNMDQVDEYQPPPNPAKESDSRAAKYIQEYGHESWELDALSPMALSDLVKDAVLEVRDDEVWQESLDRDDEDREDMTWAAKHWDDVVALRESEEDEEEETDEWE